MDQFKIIKEIGRGGYGRALLVKSIKNGETKVVKEMNLTGMTRGARESAFKEVEILSSLKHTNIIRYRGCTKQKKCLYILMDYADGGDLGAAIRAQSSAMKPMPEEVILDRFVQTALALKYLHDRKILHRDIKPQNIFLCSGGIVKLGDFGIARALEATGDMAQTAIGTPLYCSPEICSGRKYNDKSDIWSLGCVLYECATLRRPFSGRNIPEIVRSVIHKEPRQISSIYSTELRGLISSMLSKNPDERPSINDIFSLPLIKNKAIALLGRTLASSELSHGTFHGSKPGETPGNYQEAVEYNIEVVSPSSGVSAGSRQSKRVAREMERLAESLRAAIRGDSGGQQQNSLKGKSAQLLSVPVDELNEGEFYFMGRKLALKGVKDSDPLGFKVESLRVFLEELMGIDNFRTAYEAACNCGENKSEVLDLTQSDVYIYQLIMQLVAYESAM